MTCGNIELPMELLISLADAWGNTDLTRRTLDLVDKQMALERLPGMADCAARQALDDGISRIVGLPDLDRLREFLASEPVVSERSL